ncbi:MAG: radical SAM protein [Firmicutes bacterium HGW-Firmicutes-3]|nr:MAG: radical SAM protein [Firmicutes bacterium HGW-Firmicutes-3]
MELKHYNKDEAHYHEILGVEQGSIADELGIKAGDKLISINGKTVQDALDYHLFVKEEFIDLMIYDLEHDEPWLYEIEKDEEEDLGLIFDNNLMDEYRSCRNRCVFCFIDQLPKGMRETLYFKDDDARLSFLQGNYITLTNMTDREVDRIIEYHLSPINISIHTMNLELRQKMLKNKNSGKIVSYMNRLYEAGITMNGQIVLCKGLNDHDELAYSIEALSQYIPHLQSVSVVPVGLSKHRDGLYPLEPFTKEDCIEVVKLVEDFQQQYMTLHNSHFIHLGDEFYIMADLEPPSEATYDGYLQLENGVGMTRMFVDDLTRDIEGLNAVSIKPTKISLITGKLFEPTLRALMFMLEAKVQNLKLQVIGIENDFFGPKITVSGLLTGKDILHQVKGTDLGQYLYLPDNVLRNGEDVLLDDIAVSDMEKVLNTPVAFIDCFGSNLVQSILNHIEPYKNT